VRRSRFWAEGPDDRARRLQPIAAIAERAAAIAISKIWLPDDRTALKRANVASADDFGYHWLRFFLSGK
jgi:hypothetical protein